MNLKDEAFLPFTNFICYTKTFVLKKEYHFHLKSFDKTEMHFRLEYCEYNDHYTHNTLVKNGFQSC